MEDFIPNGKGTSQGGNELQISALFYFTRVNHSIADIVQDIV